MQLIRRSLRQLRVNHNNFFILATRSFSIFTVPNREKETIAMKRNRLLYESRKRGNLENGIILSTFADKYLSQMTEQQLGDYDRLINTTECDWDLFYWSTGEKEAPEEYRTGVLDMIKKHTKKLGREMRNQQPNIQTYQK